MRQHNRAMGLHSPPPSLFQRPLLLLLQLPLKARLLCVHPPLSELITRDGGVHGMTFLRPPQPPLHPARPRWHPPQARLPSFRAVGTRRCHGRMRWGPPPSIHSSSSSAGGRQRLQGCSAATVGYRGMAACTLTRPNFWVLRWRLWAIPCPRVRVPRPTQGASVAVAVAAVMVPPTGMRPQHLLPPE